MGETHLPFFFLYAIKGIKMICVQLSRSYKQRERRSVSQPCIVKSAAQRDMTQSYLWNHFFFLTWSHVCTGEEFCISKSAASQFITHSLLIHLSFFQLSMQQERRSASQTACHSVAWRIHTHHSFSLSFVCRRISYMQCETTSVRIPVCFSFLFFSPLLLS